MFYQSLVSDWNHGNAHFLRGVVTELLSRGHRTVVYEPKDSWSLKNLLADYGPKAIEEFKTNFPGLTSQQYDLAELDLDKALDDIDLVLVHEWNDKRLIEQIGDHRLRNRSFTLLFHDTHHRVATHTKSTPPFRLDNYDGVLAYGKVIADRYMANGWAKQAWTWHEAADTRVFKPLPDFEQTRDVVWVGNWGDEERTLEIEEYLVSPIKRLKLKCDVFGVRYPPQTEAAFKAAGIKYRGWIANYKVPQVFASSRVTVHIPRRPYVKLLPGIPTIRPFEALACGIPLLSSPWEDVEHLFTPGKDFLIAYNGNEIKRHLQEVLSDQRLAHELAVNGLTTIMKRHTCAHRVDELLAIYEELKPAYKTKAVNV